MSEQILWPRGGVVVSRSGLVSAAVRVVVALAVLFYCALAVAAVIGRIRAGVFGFDFQGTLWEPAQAIVHGRNPYPEATLAQVQSGNPAVYPPLGMLLVVPLTPLGWEAAHVIWAMLLAAALLGSLLLLGVRDWRCHALLLAAYPARIGVVLGNLGALLVLPVAAAWRVRARALAPGVAIGVAIALKLFLWPLLVWLLATKRFRAFGAGVATAGVGVVGAWALIGFDGFRDYPALIDVTEDAYATRSYSLATFASGLGASHAAAVALCLGVGLALACASFVAGRRGAELASFSLALLAAVLGSPIAWPYTFALLVVPLAISRPRLTPLWILFPAFSLAGRLPHPILDVVPCCRPADVPEAVWSYNHAPPAAWPALGFACVAVLLVVAALLPQRPWATTRSPSHA